MSKSHPFSSSLCSVSASAEQITQANREIWGNSIKGSFMKIWTSYREPPERMQYPLTVTAGCFWPPKPRRWPVIRIEAQIRSWESFWANGDSAVRVFYLTGQGRTSTSPGPGYLGTRKCQRFYNRFSSPLAIIITIDFWVFLSLGQYERSLEVSSLPIHHFTLLSTKSFQFTTQVKKEKKVKSLNIGKYLIDGY